MGAARRRRARKPAERARGRRQPWVRGTRSLPRARRPAWRRLDAARARLERDGAWRFGEARRLFEEAADAHGGPGDEQLQRRALMSLATVDSAQGDHARAVGVLRDVVASTRREGSTHELAIAVLNLGVSEANAGETDEARRSYEESIALSRRDARKPGLAIGLCNLGYLLRASAPSEALAHFSESLTLSREMEEPRTIAYCLVGGAGILAAQGNFTQATTLLGAASSIRAPTGMGVAPSRRAYGRYGRGAVPRGALGRSVRPGMGRRRRARRQCCRRLGTPSLGGNGIAAIAGARRGGATRPVSKSFQERRPASSRLATADPATPATMRSPRSPLTDSNRRPPPYHGGALPTELRGRRASVAPSCRSGCVPCGARSAGRRIRTSEG